MRDVRIYSIFPSNLSLSEAFRASDKNLRELGYSEAILGADYEHLVFPRGNIEKAFSDLLFALPS